ncbi:MAG: DUF998 domain-containing protein [Acidobacteria bacterium]|nr:DUF998 domain-containing protein [Acidobacteriota bacterium]
MSQALLEHSPVISDRGLRRAIGVVGMLLPVTLWLGARFVAGTPLQSSVSSYYYTVVGDVFVGAICVIGVFLMAYRGYSPADNLAGHLACLFAVGVGLFPTEPLDPDPQQELVGTIHLICAALLFVTLAYFCLALFRKTSQHRVPTAEKLRRNQIYTICGWTIIGCIALIAAAFFLSEDSPVKRLRPVFWLEAFAIMAFGISWLTKGETWLADR